MPEFLLPDLGEGLTEAELISWHVRVGDHVDVDQNVAEVETAKALVDVPIPFAGRVSALHAEPGAVVPVGAALISVAQEDRPAAVSPAAHSAIPSGEDSGSVLVGSGTFLAPRRPGRGAPGGQPGPGTGHLAAGAQAGP